MVQKCIPNVSILLCTSEMPQTDLLLYEMHCHLIMLQCFNGKISLILSIPSNHIKSSYNKSPNYMKLHQSNLTYQVRLCSIFHIVVYTCLSEARFIHSPSERNLRDSPRGRKEATFERFLSADLTWSKQNKYSQCPLFNTVFSTISAKRKLTAESSHLISHSTEDIQESSRQI